MGSVSPPVGGSRHSQDESSPSPSSPGAVSQCYLPHSGLRQVLGCKQNNREVTGACAVVFDENCCDASNDVYVISKTAKGGKDGKAGEKGKFCGGAFGISNPLSSCKDDITSLMV